MALIKCKNCGKEISDKSKQCIHCGKELTSSTTDNLEIKSLKEQVEKQEKEIEKQNIINEENERLNKENQLLKQQITKNKKKVDTKQQIKNISDKILNIIRYILGTIFLFSILGLKGFQIVTMICMVLFIYPFSTKFLYSKINVPKALRVIIPIAFLMITFMIDNNYDEYMKKDNTTQSTQNQQQEKTTTKENSTNSTTTPKETKKSNNTSAICFLNDRGAIITTTKTIILNGNSKETNVDKRYSIYIPKTSSSTIELGEDEKSYLCNDETKETKKNKNGRANCNYHNDKMNFVYNDNMNFVYDTKESTNNIINEYKNKEFNCVIYSNREQENKKIVDNWCLSFDNNGNTNNYYFTFNEDGTFTEKQVYGENGKYVKNYYGFYQFKNNNLISRINYVKDFDFGASSYDEDLSYNSNDDTIINSNIRAEFPNIMTKCN